jgi:hypothetical protein
MQTPPVYALMISGKDSKRLMYARLIGIKNFESQTYKNKHMIIINHGSVSILDQPKDNIYEVMINKGNMTLGDLRNLSLEMVPLNAIYYICDDDDWRTSNYIEYMVNELLKTKSIAVFLKNRIEYNLANGYTFNSHFTMGNTHIMSIKLDRLRYMSKDTLEDTGLQSEIASFKKKFTAIDNDPKMYIRIIHENNTSPFATDDRDSITKYDDDGNYREYESTDSEKKYASEIVKIHYGFFLYKK